MSAVYYIVTGIKFSLRPKKGIAVRMGQWMTHMDMATNLLWFLVLPHEKSLCVLFSLLIVKVQIDMKSKCGIN